MITLLNITWGVLQNLVGCIGYLFCRFILRLPTSRYRSAFCISLPNKYGSVSLGLFIFGNTGDSTIVAHEYGHTKQSAILGIFYFFIIGIPSIVWAGLFNSYRIKNKVSYYSFYTELWADKLGGIDRK